MAKRKARKTQGRSLRRAIKRERSKNRRQDREIEKLKNALAKLSARRAGKRTVSEYNLFIRRQILSGLTFANAVKQWNRYKALTKRRGRKLSAYNKFLSVQMKRGRTFKQAVTLWNLSKRKAAKPRVRVVRRIVVRRVARVPKRRVVRKRAQKIDFEELKKIVELSKLSKAELKEALHPEDEEIAFKIVQTYFIEIARIGFKRRLTLDEIINAYFYSLARVKMKDTTGAVAKEAIAEVKTK